ncbi:glycosyltransferase [Phormidesmis sp. 146-12]
MFFVEEPIYESGSTWQLKITQQDCGVWVVVPHLPKGLGQEMLTAMQRSLIDELFAEYAIETPILWYYTPMALSFTDHLESLAIVYDCMDQLSAFKGASPALQAFEQQLFDRADLVFAGGQSLYEAKQQQHSNIHAFPSSIDVPHFAQARRETSDPADQALIAHPRLGFCGVIDERMDLELLKGIATARPDWQLILIGPVVKIDCKSLPIGSNIHYLGSKVYSELPTYLAGWDVALLPFARNESTRFISPTKTPEYLAAGKPVVSTSIRDVVRPYGELGLVRVADTVEGFVAAIGQSMQDSQTSNWLGQVDAFLAQTSWDKTWMSMKQLMTAVITQKQSQTN